MKYITSIVFTLCSFLVYCQNNDVQKSILFPIETSISENQLVSNGNNVRNQMGFGVSVCRIWFSEKRFNLVSGLMFDETRLYKKEGFKDYYSALSICSYTNMQFTLQSVSIPLYLRANFGHTHRFFIEIGPSFVFDSKLQGKGTEEIFPFNASSYKKEVSKGFEGLAIPFGANIGAGFKFSVKNIKMFVESSYHCYLISVSQDGTNLNYRYVSIKLGLYFDK